jgi:hypothetical protein
MMRAHKIFLFFLPVFQFSLCIAQPRIATDSSVIVIPHWKKAETHSLVIKSSTDQFADGRNDKSSGRFNARFTVLEKDTSGYVIEWVYTKAELSADEINLENIVLANLLNQKFIIKLSLTGRFKELINYEDVKAVFDPVIDRLISGSANDEVKNVGFKAVRQATASRKNFENVLLKQVKFYNTSFGYKYKTHIVQTNPLVFPNALGGNAFNATEKLQLTKLDTLTGICIIERNSKIDDAIALKKQIIDYLIKVAKQDSTSVQKKFGNVNFDLSEKTVQTINYQKGIPQKTNFTGVVNYGFEHRNIELEIETVE